MWPLVASVSCHFDSVFSKQGISFLDAAGSGDHRLRTDTSLKLRRQCLYSLIVIGSARAANDPSVAKLVNEAKNKSDGRLIVVVTFSDMIDDSIVGGTTTDRENLTELQEMIADKQVELSNITLQKSKAKDRKRKSELQDDREELQARMKILKDNEKALRMDMRSGDTKSRLQEKLKDITGSLRPIPVTSVSNKLYEAYQTELGREDIPELSVEQTNIPTLHRAICKLYNQARMQEMYELVCHAAPSLLQKVHMLLSNDPLERKAEMEVHVKSPKESFSKCIEGMKSRLLEAAEEHIFGMIREQESTFIVAAKHLSEIYENSYKASPMLTLMNNNGRRRRNDPVNLSADFIQLSANTMGSSFSRMDPFMAEETRWLGDDLVRLVDKILDNV